MYFYLQGLVARAKETFLTLMLLSCVIMGMMYILAALIDWDERSLDRLISEFSLFLKKKLLITNAFHFSLTFKK